MRQTLKKHERLHGKKTIDQLFSQENSFFLHPFVVYHQIVPTSDGSSPVCAVLLSVSKRKIPRATQRNLLKRRMREAFRKNKHRLYDEITALQTDNLHLAFIYVSSEILNYASLEKKMMEAWEQI
jgi:ribonuclease P protein component